ncbi:hypothetical protein [Streptomyces mangrovi]|uniref:hypothetical protein n=1 Tax=Streptomyces mangrovi TaxID=1206892 RepID=UPI00399CA37E
MRRKLLVVVAGNYHYETYSILEIGGVKCIWFDRDEEGYLLLNFRMPTLSGKPRARVEQNVWTVSPKVEEVVCPPSGRLIDVKYGNGDRFRAEFFDLSNSGDLVRRYPDGRPWCSYIEYPVTVVEVYEKVAGTGISLTPKSIEHEKFSIGGNYFESLPRSAVSLEFSRNDVKRLSLG